MKRNILILCAVSILAIACSVSVSDSNPTAMSVLTAMISGGNLTLTGSGLNNVTSLSVNQGASNVTLSPIITKTASLLAAAVPAALQLPAMLTISRANAAEVYQLSALTTLTVDGTLNAGGDVNVTGITNVGRQRVNSQTNCNGIGSGVCTATCPAGTVILGGGCTISGNAGLTLNYPSGDNQWFCQAAGAGGGANVVAYAICARLNPN